MSKPSYVCILATPSRTVYVEVTKDPDVTLMMDREKSKLDLRLVYQKEFPSMLEATARAEELQEAGEASLLLLVNQTNPDWQDLCRKVFAGSSNPDQEGPDAGGVSARMPGPPTPPRSGAAAESLPSYEGRSEEVLLRPVPGHLNSTLMLS